MNHTALVQLGVQWLRRRRHEQGGPCGLVFAEMVTNAGEQPDVIGWREGRSTVIEAKVSRADFRADRKKPWMASASSGMGEQRYYLAPAGLIGIRDIPEWCGFLEVHPSNVVAVVKVAPERELDVHAMRCERLMLQSACRRHECGSFFEPTLGLWETFSERLQREEQEKRERRAAKLVSKAQLPLIPASNVA